MELSLIPIHSLGTWSFDEKFDLNKLPLEILPGLTIEDVSPLLGDDPFVVWKRMLGESLTEKLENLRYALVHRFDPEKLSPHDLYEPLNLVASCLRIVRPMRQGTLAVVHGIIRADNGKLDIRSFSLSERQTGVEVVEAHKLSTLRNQDAETLRQLASEFIRAMNGDFWKFRMAVEFHDRGYFESYNWKPRFILWCSAIESLFTSHNADHKGSRVAKARIRWFLGDNAPIYPLGGWPNTIPASELKVIDIVDDLYEMRNHLAHGDKLPDKFLTTCPREGINGGVKLAEVLSEAASFVVRESLMKILREGLLDHFADAAPAEAYFRAQGLTNSQLP